MGELVGAFNVELWSFRSNATILGVLYFVYFSWYYNSCKDDLNGHRIIREDHHKKNDGDEEEIEETN